MKKRPDEIFRDAINDLQKGVTNSMLHLQQAMQEYLSSNLDPNILYRIIQTIGIPNVIGMLNAPIPQFDYYRILGIDRNSSDDEIREHYRSIINKLHPDKAGEEMTFLATLVNIAYKMICKERGIK